MSNHKGITDKNEIWRPIVPSAKLPVDYDLKPSQLRELEELEKERKELNFPIKN